MRQPVVGAGESQKTVTEALYHRHAPAIFAFLLQQSVSFEDAEDILLEVFTAALQFDQLGQLVEDQQRRWLWRITRNKLVDTYRRAQRRPIVPVDQVLDNLFADEHYAPEDTFLRQEEYNRLYAALQTLPPLQQGILRLRFVDELRTAQIAERVGKSEVAVRAMLSRAMNVLRKCYKESEK